MKYGFVIDNRKCIGCHACTTACKSEHDVAVGVNRTWVKYVEKGVFPDSRRLFSVMRCNHCTDAPCVEICPVESLFIRDDGIVDFDNRRCIGCKSCTQACPYDALYIDPKTNTAAKCNYCTHRVDIGLEPACVNVCPVGAIVSGDMENPETNIAKLISRHPVSVRKGEKGTNPNLFYIDGDQASLQPSAALDDVSMWSSQTLGVGHYAKEAEKMAFTNPDVISAIQEGNKEKALNGTTILDVMKGKPRKAYRAPEKGILWGWEVSGYVWTKAISAGSFLVLFLATLFGVELSDPTYWWTFGMGLFFLMATGVLLVMDLDQPTRFLNVLLRPQWKSWLVKGGYAISIYGGLISLLAALRFFEVDILNAPLMGLTAAIAIIVAIYTAFLFAQAKGRDFWQSPTLVIHMLVHSFMAGAAAFGILTAVGVNDNAAWMGFLKMVMVTGIIINFMTIVVEITITHPTSDAKKTVKMITKGRYKNLFWGGVMLFGNILPVLMLSFMGLNPMTLALAGAIVLIGIYFTEKIWVEAPQRIPLS